MAVYFFPEALLFSGYFSSVEKRDYNNPDN